MQRLVDFLIPNNCRAELKLAAARNAHALGEVIDLLRGHPHQLTEAMKSERRSKRRA